jgi:hypothetical protein
MGSYTRVGVIIGITPLTTLGATLTQQVYAAIEDGAQLARKALIAGLRKAPIATSGDNVYIAWWTNKTGNDEIIFVINKAAGLLLPAASKG